MFEVALKAGEPEVYWSVIQFKMKIMLDNKNMQIEDFRR